MRRTLLLWVLAVASPAAAQVGTNRQVPVPLPDRPFLLLDAPRRFLPSEPAEVRIQVREGGNVQLSLFRWSDPAPLLAQAGRRDGVSVAATALGDRAEALVAQSTPLPREEAGLTLLRHERLAMSSPEGARRVVSEALVYDSSEEVEENVATYGVETGRWAVRRVSLGRLEVGLYLVQVRAAAWVASALVSVGELVVVARRGDGGDLVRVTDPDGAPLAGVVVRALDGERELGRTATGGDGIARFAASDVETLRFQAERGPDVAWADVAHVRLSPCDPRVYLATGRPFVREGERLFVRGHVRGCDAGRFAPLAHRTVSLESGGQRRDARTDADGNFAVELVAGPLVRATLDGRAHEREVRIDHRVLPTRSLVVEADRPWAGPGEVVEVKVADEDGGWPTESDVVLDTPRGRLVAPIGPGRPARFHVLLPEARNERITLHASLAEAGSVTLASTAIFVGGAPPEGELDGAAGAASAGSSSVERVGPSPLGARGELAVAPASASIAPGGTMTVRLRAPSRGASWLTLEQGGVLEQRIVHGREVRLPVPDGARGLASLVLTHVHRGRVRTASATVEVATSSPFALEVASDRDVFGPGERARVTVEAKRGDAPHDAVISLWLADAGYWDLGEDTYPMPDAYFRLPGRPASGADSSVPVAFGAEEGRRLASELLFDGRKLEQATHRHGWGYGGDVVRLSARGSYAAIASALARAAGLRGARVACDEDTREHALVAQDLPWDLVAERLAAVRAASARVEAGRLVIDCSAPPAPPSVGSFGVGSGNGGMGGGGRTVTRGERLYGVLHFVGLARLGPDGRLELDVPMPERAGRWRIEVLAIADDAAGARAHRVIHTRAALDGWIRLPRDLVPGDVAEGVIHVESHTGAESARVELGVPPHLLLTRAPPATIPLDANGRGQARFAVAAQSEGTRPIELRIAASGAEASIAAALTVHPPATERALYFGAVIADRATTLDVPLPDLAREATLSVDLDEDVEREVRRLFDALREPRWDMSVMRADRLDSLAALRRVAHARGARALARELDRAIEAELHALEALQTGTGEIGWGDHADPRLTLEVLEHVPPRLSDDWSAARAHLGRRLARGELPLELAARASRLVGPGEGAAEAVLMRALDEGREDPVVLTEVLLAADHHHLARVEAEAAELLIQALEARLAGPAEIACRGWAFHLCFARRGDRGALARAALALARAGHRRAAEVAGRVGAWVAAEPPMHADFAWGSDEADLLELLATRPRGHDRIRASLDGRPVAVENGRVRIPPGAHRLELEFAPREGRLRRVVVAGRVAMRAPTNPDGNVRLERRFERRGGRFEGVVTYVLPRAARDVVLEVPIPAGLTADMRQLGVPRAALVNGALRIRFPRLERGRHELRVPMLATGAGSFTAFPARVTTSDPEIFGVTESQRVEVR